MNLASNDTIQDLQKNYSFSNAAYIVQTAWNANWFSGLQSVSGAPVIGVCASAPPFKTIQSNIIQGSTYGAPIYYGYNISQTGSSAVCASVCDCKWQVVNSGVVVGGNQNGNYLATNFQNNWGCQMAASCHPVSNLCETFQPYYFNNASVAKCTQCTSSQCVAISNSTPTSYNWYNYNSTGTC
jgi:hypothetical protein